MALFQKKKPDPISERARALNVEIAALRSKIETLDTQLQKRQSQPIFRSTAVPHGGTITHNHVERPAQTPQPAANEPVFEEVGREVLSATSEPNPATSAHFNEMGVRKYDLPALLKRVRDYFRGPSASNPRLISYLAAGGVQGLRPMRYEKRVARNRFILFSTLLFLLLLGMFWWFMRHR